jgi:zinc/manganese transport system substrate-binding protein
MIGRTKVIIVVVAVVALVGAGVTAGYILSPIPNPCANVPESPGPGGGTLTNSTDSHAPPGVHPATRAAASEISAIHEASPTSPESASAQVPPVASDEVINVVAAENFWGSLVSQIGGTHVNVTSIITDPNTDPHEYESNDSTAIAIAHAQYVILNNVGYDTWATGLVAADGQTNQTILNLGDSLGVKVGGGIVTGNPHLWYNPTYVLQAVAWMYHNLTTIAPSLAPYFTAQYNNLTASLVSLYAEVSTIKQLFAGTEVASTESIFVYLANATGLDLVSPPEFMEAVAEGSDPPDQSVITFQCQLESGFVKVLVFNAQTVTPVTTTMKDVAQAHNVSVMSVTETVVPNEVNGVPVTFQAWMGGELNSLYVALDANALGQ